MGRIFNATKSFVKGFALLNAGYFIAYPQLKTKTEFHFDASNQVNTELLDKVTTLKEYRPPFFYSGKLRQTLFQVYVSKDVEIPIAYERKLLTMQDGGTTSIDWAKPEANGLEARGDKLCVVYPGLSGGADRGYVKSLVRTLL
jgi:predicted alpha/beta-fold hydrolase